MKKPHIVILGAGYGGMITTINLQKSLSVNEATITLVNNNDYHYITTSLHETAAGTLHHDQARVPIKDLVDLSKVNFMQETVVSVKPEEKKVILEDRTLEYDILVLGLGFEPATFGIPGLLENSFTIGNTNSARLIREHIEYNFAVYNTEKEKNEARLNIVVGGAGFTGIEFIGELANKLPELCKEYDIDRSDVRLIGVEGAPTVMPGFDPQLIEYATNSLQARGVEFITGAMLKECTSNSITYEKDGEKVEIPTLTTVWAAGVQANSIVAESGFETNRGKVEARDTMQTPDYENVFAVGDSALIWNTGADRPYPPTAQMAVQAADVVAKNIQALVRGEELVAFEPKIMGTVASLGHNDAIGTILNNRLLFGWQGTVMKKVIDNRYLFKLGGLGLLLKKGKFNIFY